MENKNAGIQSSENQRLDVSTLAYEEWLKRRAPLPACKTGCSAQYQKGNLSLQYFQKQPSSYIAEITSLVSSAPHMLPECRLIIMIITYGEELNIGRTLAQYTGMDINPKIYEIVLLDN